MSEGGLTQEEADALNELRDQTAIPGVDALRPDREFEEGDTAAPGAGGVTAHSRYLSVGGVDAAVEDASDVAQGGVDVVQGGLDLAGDTAGALYHAPGRAGQAAGDVVDEATDPLAGIGTILANLPLLIGIVLVIWAVSTFGDLGLGDGGSA